MSVGFCEDFLVNYLSPMDSDNNQILLWNPTDNAMHVQIQYYDIVVHSTRIAHLQVRDISIRFQLGTGRMLHRSKVNLMYHAHKL